jgi:putative DNA primase/helicase
MDRIGRGSVYVSHLCLSLFGGIQPVPLQTYLTGNQGEISNDDGLIQRFQILVWPDPPTTWKYLDRKPNHEALAQAEQVYQSIARMDPTQPRRLKFSDEAQKLFIEWLTELETKLRSEDLSPSLQAHLAKYRSLMPTLALLFALADSCSKGIGFLNTVGLDHAQQAADWCDYLEAHARRVYAVRISPEIRAAHTLAKKLKSGWKQEEGKEHVFTARDVYRNGWTGLTSPEQTCAALTVLEEAGWVKSYLLDTGGRPTELYAINPKIGHGDASN